MFNYIMGWNSTFWLCNRIDFQFGYIIELISNTTHFIRHMAHSYPSMCVSSGSSSYHSYLYHSYMYMYVLGIASYVYAGQLHFSCNSHIHQTDSGQHSSVIWLHNSTSWSSVWNMIHLSLNIEALTVHSNMQNKMLHHFHSSIRWE